MAVSGYFVENMLCDFDKGNIWVLVKLTICLFVKNYERFSLPMADTEYPLGLMIECGLELGSIFFFIYLTNELLILF